MREILISIRPRKEIYTATQNTFLGMSSTLEIFANSSWTTFLSVKNLLYPAQLIHQYGAYQTFR